MIDLPTPGQFLFKDSIEHTISTPQTILRIALKFKYSFHTFNKRDLVFSQLSLIVRNHTLRIRKVFYSAATMPDEEYSKIVGELKTLIEKNGLVGDFARGIEKGFG